MNTNRKCDPFILIVDDNKDIRDSNAAVLGANGFETVTASSSDEALELFKQRNIVQRQEDSKEKIRGVLLDFDLGPGQMNGVQLAEAIRKLDPLVIIAMLTGSPSEARMFALLNEIEPPRIYEKGATDTKDLIDAFRKLQR